MVIDLTKSKQLDKLIDELKLKKPNEVLKGVDMDDDLKDAIKKKEKELADIDKKIDKLKEDRGGNGEADVVDELKRAEPLVITLTVHPNGYMDLGTNNKEETLSSTRLRNILNSYSEQLWASEIYATVEAHYMKKMQGKKGRILTKDKDIIDPMAVLDTLGKKIQ